MANNEQVPNTGSASLCESVRRWATRAGRAAAVGGVLYFALTNGVSGAEEGRISRGLQEQLALEPEQVTVKLPFDANPYDANEHVTPRAFIDGFGCVLDVDYMPPDPGGPPLQLVDTTPNDNPLDGWRLAEVQSDGAFAVVTASHASDIVAAMCGDAYDQISTHD